MSFTRSLPPIRLSLLRPSPVRPSRHVHITHIRPRPNAPTPPPRPVSTGSMSGSSSAPPAKRPSPHLVWYREIVPAMVPILLLSSTIFLSLTLLRTHLSHNLSLAESSDRIAELEGQLEKMRRDQKRIREKERKERERILPMVVERVLQRVGAMSEEVEEDEEVKESGKEAKLLV